MAVSSRYVESAFFLGMVMLRVACVFSLCESFSVSAMVIAIVCVLCLCCCLCVGVVVGATVSVDA